MRGKSRGAERILHSSYCKGTTFPLPVVRICPCQSASVLLFHGENRFTCTILCYYLQKQEKPSLQHVSDFQSLQDERYLFFLGCKHPDKNCYLSSLALGRAITYFVSKNTSFYQSLKNKDYHRHLYV